MSPPPVKRPYKAWAARAAEAEIAFFGGSFTAIGRGYMLRLLDAARPYVRAGKVRGIRLSTRPDAVEPEVLSLLREYGVTTIELGAQSMDDRVLALNGGAIPRTRCAGGVPGAGDGLFAGASDDDRPARGYP